MKLVDARIWIGEVATEWEKFYGPDMSSNEIDILNKLKELDPQTATTEDIHNITGNWHWASPQQCTECGKRCDVVVEFDNNLPNNELEIAWICKDCLEKALGLFKDRALD